MKKSKILVIGALAGLTIASLSAMIAINAKNSVEAKGYTAQSIASVTTIDLNDTSASNIRSYYSSLNNLSTSERQGTNLLKNLKPILKNNQKYYAYDGASLWAMYEITDRDWSKSPASAISGYNASTKMISNYSYGSSYSNPGMNPYIHELYINRDVDNQCKAWTKTGSEASHGGNKEWYIDQEHIWPKSQGFNESGAGGARGDPMHLWPGDSYVNSALHSNNFYGYVNTSSSYTDGKSKYSEISGNYLGKSLNISGTDSVFEPQDSDKGDIARAIFYMVARYNYYSGSDSDGIDANNPNLELVQSSTSLSSYTSRKDNKGKMGILTDLLQWNRIDPPDEFEIHRNNLLYTNYTNNRNPFIDFPEWAEFIWGDVTYNGRNLSSYSSTPTGYATPSSDSINTWNGESTVSVTGVSVSPSSASIEVGQTQQLTATVTPSNATNQAVSYSSNKTNIATVDSDGLVTAVGTGTATITVTTQDGNKTATCSITVTAPAAIVSDVTVSPSTLNLDLNGDTTGQLSATVNGSNNPSQTVTWTSGNTSIATVSNTGLVTAQTTGQVTITATSVLDNTKSGSCVVTITDSTASGNTSSGSVIASGGELSSWTAEGTGSAYQDGSVKMDSGGDYVYSTTIFTGDVSYFMTSLSVTINGKINGTPAANNSYKVEAIDINGNALDAEIKTGVSIYTSSDYSNVTFDLTDNLSGCVGIRITYATKGGGNWAIASVSWTATYSDNPGTPIVTAVTVTPSTLSLDLNGNASAQLSVSVTGRNNPSNIVSWSSSNDDVASVSNSGLVIAHLEGTVTITATSSVNSNKKGICAVTITDSSIVIDPDASPYLNGVPYKMFFYSTSKTNDYYFIGSMGEGNQKYYGATSTSYSDGVDVYFEENGDGQNIYMKNGNNKKYFYVTDDGSHINFNCDATSASSLSPWVYSSDNDCMVYQISTTYYTFGTSGSYTTFSAFSLPKTSHYKVQFTLTPEGYSQIFYDAINCDSTGTNSPSFASGYSWTKLGSTYSNLKSDAQSVLQSAEKNENGSTYLAKAMYRYDYIVGKYGTANYADFIGRNPASIGRAPLTIFSEVTPTSMTAIIVLLTLVGVTSICVIVTLKKRKEN